MAQKQQGTGQDTNIDKTDMPRQQSGGTSGQQQPQQSTGGQRGGMDQMNQGGHKNRGDQQSRSSQNR